MKKTTKHLIAVIGIVLIISLIVCYFICRYLFYDVDIVFCDVDYHLLPTDSELKLKEEGIWVEESPAMGFIEEAQRNNGEDKEYITTKELEKVIAKYRFKVNLTSFINSTKDPDRYLKLYIDKRIEVCHDERYNVYLVLFRFSRENEDGEIVKDCTCGIIDCFDGEMVYIDGIPLHRLY